MNDQQYFQATSLSYQLRAAQRELALFRSGEAYTNLNDKKLDLLIYVGNDIEEDIIKEERIISLISGEFLDKLLAMDKLKRRG